jgi:hypothetical protein
VVQREGASRIRVSRFSWAEAYDRIARTVAGAGGGYVIAALMAAFLPRVLPMSKGEATVAATLGSYVFYAVSFLFAVSARSVSVVWIGLSGLSAILITGLLIF